MRPEAARRLAKAERFLHQATILDETVMTETVRAESRRLVADYDDVPAEEDDAASVRTSAVEFLALCRQLLGA